MPAILKKGSSFSLPPLLSTADVLEILGISRPTLWRLEKRGEFPKAILLGRAKRWQRNDIAAFLDARSRVAA